MDRRNIRYFLDCFACHCYGFPIARAAGIAGSRDGDHQLLRLGHFNRLQGAENAAFIDSLKLDCLNVHSEASTIVTRFLIGGIAARGSLLTP